MPKVRVLVVDDEPAVARAIARQMEGFADSVVVGTAAEAVSTLEAESFDVVLTDLQMEGTDGLALLRTVHDRWPAVRRVLMSGIRLMDDERVALAHAYLIKPLASADLRVAILCE